MSEDEQPKYVIDESAMLAQVMAAVRVLAIVSGGMTAIMGFLSAHDIAALWVWLQHEDGVKFVGALIAVGTFLYGQYKTRMRHKRAVEFARKLPDKLVKVREKTNA